MVSVGMSGSSTADTAPMLRSQMLISSTGSFSATAERAPEMALADELTVETIVRLPEASVRFCARRSALFWPHDTAIGPAMSAAATGNRRCRVFFVIFSLQSY